MKPFIDWSKFKEVGLKQLGKPYSFGVEVKMSDLNPSAFDCSELVEWLYAQVNIKVPDGSENQYFVTSPVQYTLQTGDLGFFFDEATRKTKHVGILIDEENVLEARGFEPSLEAAGIKTNRVILRAREKWEGWHEFSGWRRLELLK